MLQTVATAFTDNTGQQAVGTVSISVLSLFASSVIMQHLRLQAHESRSRGVAGISGCVQTI